MNVKKIIVLLLVLLLNGCILKTGDISNVQIINAKSNVFTNKDLNDGIKTVLNFFKKEYKGCELLNVKYVGDDKNNYDDWAKRNNKEEAIVFISDYIVHDNSYVPSLSKDKYRNWNWILVRNKGEKWILVDNGY